MTYRPTSRAIDDATDGHKGHEKVSFPITLCMQVCSSKGEELCLRALRVPNIVQERPHQARERRPPRHQGQRLDYKKKLAISFTFI